MVDKEIKRDGPFSMWKTTKGYYSIYEDDPKYGEKAVKKGMVMETAEREWNQLINGTENSIDEISLRDRRNSIEDAPKRISMVPSRSEGQYNPPSRSEILSNEMSWFDLD